MSTLTISLYGNNPKGQIRLSGSLPSLSKYLQLVEYQIIYGTGATPDRQISIELDLIGSDRAGAGDGSQSGVKNRANSLFSNTEIPLSTSGTLVTSMKVDRRYYLKSRLPKIINYKVFDDETGLLLDNADLKIINLHFNLQTNERIL